VVSLSEEHTLQMPEKRTQEFGPKSDKVSEKLGYYKTRNLETYTV
jgi:hypothetical protein